jgi:hypothetical protein
VSSWCYLFRSVFRFLSLLYIRCSSAGADTHSSTLLYCEIAILLFVRYVPPSQPRTRGREPSQRRSGVAIALTRILDFIYLRTYNFPSQAHIASFPHILRFPSNSIEAASQRAPANPVLGKLTANTHPSHQSPARFANRKAQSCAATPTVGTTVTTITTFGPTA